MLAGAVHTEHGSWFHPQPILLTGGIVTLLCWMLFFYFQLWRV